MRRYRYSYHTSVKYDTAVSAHHFLLRCTPRDEDFQRVVESSVDLLSSAKVSRSKDTFGNDIIYGSMQTRHNIFVVAASGAVECDTYRIADPSPSPIYIGTTHSTHLSPQMVEFCNSIECSGGELDEALAIADNLHRSIKYQSGVTSVDSSAADAFALGCGVCQDLSHMLIAMCRYRGIKSRYVAGLVVGTGETHAWVEVYSNGEWRGVDPTHNTLIEWGYIKLAHGRDASDCSVSRGVHCGVTPHTTDVKVIVEEVKR